MANRKLHVTYVVSFLLEDARARCNGDTSAKRATGVGIIMRRHCRMTYAETTRVLGNILAKCDVLRNSVVADKSSLLKVPPN